MSLAVARIIRIYLDFSFIKNKKIFDWLVHAGQWKKCWVPMLIMKWNESLVKLEKQNQITC